MKDDDSSCLKDAYLYYPIVIVVCHVLVRNVLFYVSTYCICKQWQNTTVCNVVMDALNHLRSRIFAFIAKAMYHISSRGLGCLVDENHNRNTTHTCNNIWLCSQYMIYRETYTQGYQQLNISKRISCKVVRQCSKTVPEIGLDPSYI